MNWAGRLRQRPGPVILGVAKLPMDDGMIDNLEPFESAETLIQAGNDGIEKFEIDARTFLSECSYSLVRKTEPRTGNQVLKFVFDRRVPPRLRHQAGSIINDLRHALDHGFADAAILLGRRDAKGIYFPFCKSANEIDQQIRNVCKGVDAELCDFAKNFQPYLGGDDLLYVITSLAGANKHQRILRISYNADGFILDGDKLSAMVGPFELGLKEWNEIRNEITFARIMPGGYIGDDIKDYFTPDLTVVLGDGKAPLIDPAPAVLRVFASKVDSIIMGLKAEVARILESRQP